jgi:hypothetical protein
MATLAELQTELATYKTARDAILAGAQSYSIAGRQLTRASLEYIQSKIEDLESSIYRRGTGPTRVVPTFINNR